MTPLPRLLTLLTVLLAAPSLRAAVAPAPADPQALADAIDRLLADHWRRNGLTPAPQAEEGALLRRVTLALAGRVPTVAETDAFARDRSPERYRVAVRRLLDGPEFAWHFGTVLDDLIQGREAGSAEFLGYLRQSVRDRKGWDVLF